LVPNTMETSLKLAHQITSSPTVAVLAVTKFHFCCIALTCQTYFLQFLNFMSGGALVSQERPFALRKNSEPFCRSATVVILYAAGRRSPNHASASSSALASFRSSVSKPSVNQPRPEREDRGPLPACPDRAKAVRCSSPHPIPRTWPAAYVRLRTRARNMLPLSPHPAPATLARFRLQCDTDALPYRACAKHTRPIWSPALPSEPVERRHVDRVEVRKYLLEFGCGRAVHHEVSGIGQR